VLKYLLEKFPLVTNLHIISDGPTSQYRCKDYFYLLTTVIPLEFPQILFITHNFSKAGHGKGVPDGVGGVLKNLADDAVAYGVDVHNFDSFVSVLEKCVKTVWLAKVYIQDITEVDKKCVKGLKPYSGTMKVHQLLWHKERKDEVFFRFLSCFSCFAELDSCSNSMGLPWKPKELKRLNMRVAEAVKKRDVGDPPDARTKRRSTRRKAVK